MGISGINNQRVKGLFSETGHAQGGLKMKVEVLGSGCKRCEQLYENTLSAVSDMDPEGQIKVEKVNDVNYFTKKGVFATPGLVIDGRVASVGKVLSVEEIKEKISENLR